MFRYAYSCTPHAPADPLPRTRRIQIHFEGLYLCTKMCKVARQRTPSMTPSVPPPEGCNGAMHTSAYESRSPRRSGHGGQATESEGRYQPRQILLNGRVLILEDSNGSFATGQQIPRWSILFGTLSVHPCIRSRFACIRQQRTVVVGGRAVVVESATSSSGVRNTSLLPSSRSLVLHRPSCPAITLIGNKLGVFWF